jgi:cell filamentation protein
VVDPYLLPGTDVLRNRAGITDATVLADFEFKASLARVAELECRPVEGNFDLRHLCAIHRHIFCDVYDWAGVTRTVDIAKGMFFCRCDAIESESRRVFGAIANDNYLVGLSRAAFVAKLADHWGEVNALHPFREGNTRRHLLWFSIRPSAARTTLLRTLFPNMAPRYGRGAGACRPDTASCTGPGYRFLVTTGRRPAAR